MKIKGSKTEKNLMAAFAGESQASNRYTYFAGAAKKEDYIQVSKIFEETAEQEKEHAKRFFKFLEGGEAMVEAAFPAGVIGGTAANLKAAADGEGHEWGRLYPAFAKTAREEGLEEIAKVFEAVSVAEKQHERRFRGLLKNLEEGKAFKKDSRIKWRCLNCGYVHEGEEAPKVCPACAHPRAYFEMLAENW
ncbi:MAG: rubrerythrin family protein [Elusimicrobia bacterium]|nr:rubrerythrin family protein [Elusimicrobiota bacterium]